MDELDNVLDSITDDINGENNATEQQWSCIIVFYVSIDVANILGNSLEIALEREAQPFIDGTNALLDREY